MSDLAKRYRAIHEALRDGPLRPAELRAATNLSRHQIGRAVAANIDAGDIDVSKLVVYDPTRNVYLVPDSPGEFARAQIPGLKGSVTRCDRTLLMLDLHDKLAGGPNPYTLRTRKTIEAHREQALEMLAGMRQLAQEE